MGRRESILNAIKEWEEHDKMRYMLIENLVHEKEAFRMQAVEFQKNFLDEKQEKETYIKKCADMKLEIAALRAQLDYWRRKRTQSIYECDARENGDGEDV